MLKSTSILMPKVIRPKYIYQTNFCTSGQTNDEDKQKLLEKIAKEASIDEPPTMCCGTGCSNCVFIVWAEALTAKIQNAGPDVCDKILNNVDDPSMKAYLEMELRMRGIKK